MGTKEKRIKGSYRVMRVGWGNLAGSNVKNLKKGVGRYSNIKSYWREGLDFHDLDKLDYCKDVTVKEPGAISALSSNVRTFGATDPARLWNRVSGAPMTKPNGIEIRIFDHFNSNHLSELCKIIVYVAENSKRHKCNKYVYKNKSWIKALHNIMKNGWNAKLPIGYINELQKNLGLKIKCESTRAYDVFDTVNKELFKVNRKGDIPYLMLEREYTEPPTIPNINRNSWEFGFIMKMEREKKYKENLIEVLNSIKKDKITRTKFKNEFYKHFNKELWEKQY